MDAQNFWATLGFKEGRLDTVRADLEGGHLQAVAAEMDPEAVRWLGPIRFQRDDGWIGEAESGLAPRPDGTLERIDLKAFTAHRALAAGHGDPPVGGSPLDPGRHPRRRSRGLGTAQAGRAPLPPGAPGPDSGSRRGGPAQGPPHRGSPSRRARRAGLGCPDPEQPPHGRAAGPADVAAPGTRPGSERARAPSRPAAGQGTPDRWEFEGPIRANLTAGGNLRGDRLTWDRGDLDPGRPPSHLEWPAGAPLRSQADPESRPDPVPRRGRWFLCSRSEGMW